MMSYNHYGHFKTFKCIIIFVYFFNTYHVMLLIKEYYLMIHLNWVINAKQYLDYFLKIQYVVSTYVNN